MEAGLRYSKFTVPPVTVIKKRIKVFIYYICVLMLNISSNVPHVQNYYSMDEAAKRLKLMKKCIENAIFLRFVFEYYKLKNQLNVKLAWIL